MSRPSDLSNDRADVYAYVQRISKIPQVSAIRLVGSRSPLHHKTPRSFSDWDLVAVSADVIHIPSPRSLKLLHCDLVTVRPETVYPNQVEVWPTDEYGVFDGLAK